MIKYLNCLQCKKNLFYRLLLMQRLSGRRVAIYVYCEFYLRNFLEEIFIKKYFLDKIMYRLH